MKETVSRGGQALRLATTNQAPLDRLSPLQHVLPQGWRERCANFVDAVGHQQIPTSTSLPGCTTRGPASPKSETELAALLASPYRWARP
jgi:hypothetical protein